MLPHNAGNVPHSGLHEQPLIRHKVKPTVPKDFLERHSTKGVQSSSQIYQEPRSDSECLSNIREFLKGCGLFRVETFEANDLYQGQNFSKVLTSLVALNKVTADIGVGSDSVCSRHSSSHRIKSFDSLGSQSSVTRSSKLFQNQYRSLDMTDNCSHQLVVKARFNFQQTNEDELSFSKGDIINVTRVEEGGWWEGTINGKTGWFPSNYVREIKGNVKPFIMAPKRSATASGAVLMHKRKMLTIAEKVLQNILETESDYAKELQSLLTIYLRLLQPTEKLSSTNITHILGNLEEISTFQQMLVQSLEECTKLPDTQQRIGGFFLNLMPQMKSLYLTYCANHPSAVNVLTEHRWQWRKTPVQKTRKEKKREEKEEDYHPDRPDIQKAMTTFKNLSAQCQEVRKRKELELQILTEVIRCWEGDDIKTLGNVIFMSQVMIHCAGSEEKNERYLLLFPHVLLMLSASPRMSGFIYQGKLPLTGMTILKLEDTETHKNAFEISGNMIDRIIVSCNNQQDLQDWVDHLQKQTRVSTIGAPPMKPQSVPCHTVSTELQ
ncbi:ARHG7 factor, partial [Polypterus senegalus]